MQEPQPGPVIEYRKDDRSYESAVSTVAAEDAVVVATSPSKPTDD